MRGFLFPGQGAQFVGMGHDLYDAFELARRTYEEAGDIVHCDIARLSFQGPETLLLQTQYAQLAIFVHSFTAFSLLRERGVFPDAVAGHSLGEYAALTAGGVLDFPETLRLVKLRGDLMAGCLGGTMAAVIGLPDADVESVCLEASSAGTVVPANYNAPGQVVISGDEAAVGLARQLAEARSARVVPLRVSGAFHSPLMEGAAAGMTAALSEARLSPPTLPVVHNVTGGTESSPERIRAILASQLTSPVRWVDCIRTLLALGVDTCLEVGPGAVLKGLARKIDRKLPVEQAGDVAGIDRAGMS